MEQVLALLQLEGLRHRKPAELSGGQRQRVALARAVVNKPCCVLYDEPHAGLDPVTGDSIDHLIKDLARDHGITNVVVTHELRSVFRIADRIIFMKEGLIYWDGGPEELQKSADPVLANFVAGRATDSDL